MCASDVVALAAVREARSLGLDIPRDLALLGVDNAALQCEFGQTPLSSVDPDHQGLAAAAVRFVRERLENPVMEERTRWHPPGGVAQRASTSLLAMEDPKLIRAVKKETGRSPRELRQG
jgi:DNA-binding LacI/PurR family transcriptional regulator